MNPFDISKRDQCIIELDEQLVPSESIREIEMLANSINVDLDKPIYRYMKWEHLQEFYTNKRHEWVLVHSCMWQDKYEHFIFKCEKFHSIKMNIDIEISHLAKNFYAQCWTFIEESSMQWQVCKAHSNSCHDNMGDDNGIIWVKIRTTPRRLLEAMFYSSENLVCNNLMTYFIGKVEYLDNDSIENFSITNPYQLIDQKGLQQVLFLLQKRKPYEQEHEVRLIMQVDSDFCNRHPDNIIRRKVDDWYELVDEIVLDPWVTAEQERNVKDFLGNLSLQENKPVIDCWKSHLNSQPRYIVPTLDI